MLVPGTPDAALFVSVEAAAKRLRIDVPADETDDLTRLVRAAIATAAKRLGRILQAGTYEWQAPSWDAVGRIPVVPVRDITAVAYVDAAGATQTLGSAAWASASDDRGCTVAFTSPGTLPVLPSSLLPVRLTLEAGFKADDARWKPDAIDEQLVLMLVGHWHANRAAVGDAALASVPLGFEDLVALRRIYW